MKKKSQKKKITRISDLIDSASLELKRLRYQQNTIDRFEEKWRKFQHFANVRRRSVFSLDLSEEFIAHKREGFTGKPRAFQSWVTAMHCLNEVYTTGAFMKRSPMKCSVLKPLPKKLRARLSDYDQHREQYHSLSFSGKYRCNRELERFAMFVAEHGVRDFAEMSSHLVNDYIQSRFLCKPKTLQSVTSFLRCFFRYLENRQVIGMGHSEVIPKIRMVQHQHVPDAWDAEDVKRLLAAVDRNSPMGKRDYAILLLAARLGLRSADIRRLTLDNLDWEESQIVFSQSKSGKTMKLPITEDVGEALIDYLKHARPAAECREVFVRYYAPFTPFGPQNNLHGIITLYRRKAGIKAPRATHKGLHSLRHTLATRMLNDGVALETISSVLGHASSDTTRIYAKASVETLRGVAMSLSEVTHE